MGRLSPDGARFEEEVRAYDFASFVLEAQAAQVLEIRLEDASATLAVDLESASGTTILAGARPAPDGMRVVVGESGTWRLRVAISGDAARAGRSARFVLFIRILPSYPRLDPIAPHYSRRRPR